VRNHGTIETVSRRAPARGPMLIIAYILLSGSLGVIGQLILKRAVGGLGPLTLSIETLGALALLLLLNPLVMLGIAIILCGTFFWLIALSRVDLGYAYPFASLNYVLVLMTSWWLLGERPSPARLIGVGAICLGVWAISRTRAKTIARERPREPLIAPMAAGGSER
jgi:drug/metabolite transporter (DMT)-like permease